MKKGVLPIFIIKYIDLIDNRQFITGIPVNFPWTYIWIVIEVLILKGFSHVCFLVCVYYMIVSKVYWPVLWPVSDWACHLSIWSSPQARKYLAILYWAMSTENLCFGFPNKYDTTRVVPSQNPYILRYEKDSYGWVTLLSIQLKQRHWSGVLLPCRLGFRVRINKIGFSHDAAQTFCFTIEEVAKVDLFKQLYLNCIKWAASWENRIFLHAKQKRRSAVQWLHSWSASMFSPYS